MSAEQKVPSKVLLVSYPKIVFLYPTFVVALVAAIYLSLVRPPLDPASTPTIVLSVIFLGVWSTNLCVLAFNFPRTSSLALLFLAVAVAMACTLLFVLQPQVLPYIAARLSEFHPLANASFYWVFALSLGLATLGAVIVARFDRWEARPNELLHHQGLWGNMDRFSAPSVRFDKEISDVFEYFLLQSGRLTLHFSGERGSIVLNNVLFIKRKERTLTRILGALQVAIRPESEERPNSEGQEESDLASSTR